MDPSYIAKLLNEAIQPGDMGMKRQQHVLFTAHSGDTYSLCTLHYIDPTNLAACAKEIEMENGGVAAEALGPEGQAVAEEIARKYGYEVTFEPHLKKHGMMGMEGESVGL